MDRQILIHYLPELNTSLYEIDKDIDIEIN